MSPDTRNSKWLITAAVMIPTLMEILDTSVANVALPHIQGSLSAGQDEVTWVLTSYLVANAIVIPMSGWLARIMGRKTYLLISVGVFLASSVLCGAATSLTGMVLFRIVQGLGGGGLQPMSQAILLETYPPEKRGLAMGIFGMGVVVGPILGPLVGGYITDNASWRWIFYINVPFGLLGAFMILSFVFDPPYQQRRGAGEKVDYGGLLLLSLGLGSLQIVLDKGQRDDWFSSNFILTLTIVAAVCLTALVFWELRQERPILDLRIFRDRSFATGNGVMFLAFFAFFGSIVLLPLFLQNLLGYTAYLAGMVLGPGGAIAMVMLPLIGRLTERIDARLLLGVGLLITAYSVYYMAGFNLQIDFWTAVTGRLIQGIGMPFIFVAAAYVAMAYVPKEDMNNASAIFNLIRNLGGSFGVSFVTTVIDRRAQFHQNRLIEHMTPFNPTYSLYLENLKSYLGTQLGSVQDHTYMAGSLIYRSLLRQAESLAFNDAFYIQACVLVTLIGVLWIIQKPPMGKGSSSAEKRPPLH